MTELLISGTPDAMAERGRPQINHEAVPCRLPAGAKARIQAVLEPRESQADFLRTAVEAELKRRERKR